MRRGTMLVLCLMLASTAVPQGAQARSLLGSVVGVLTAPLGGILRSGRHHGRAYHRRASRARSVIAHARPATIAAPAAAGGAVAAVTANPTDADDSPRTTGSAPSGDSPASDTAPVRATQPAARLGTVGPVAWPGAFEDVIGYTLWPQQYRGRLGAHGIGDVLSTALAPTASIAARTKQARAGTPASDDAGPACGTIDLTANDWPIAELGSTIKLDDAQSSALDRLRVAMNDAIASIKATCRANADLGPVERLHAMQTALWAVHDATQLIRAPLAAFYASLNEEQKRAFAAPAQPTGGRQPSRGEMARMCDLPAQADAPIRQIEQAVRPTAAERASLEALEKRSSEMGQFLLASCLSPVPETPAQRLDTAADRLTAVIFAISNVNTALNDFTSQLNGEQKAKLDSIAR
jgi:hypothetical protein